jgi:glycerophosphoryl diester phosphodiesterase
MTATSPNHLVIARGGASTEAPENTIPAFELAIAQGADVIQLPVHLSKDEHPVVIGGASLALATGGSGRVGERTLRELKRLDAGSWHHARFRGQRVQALEEVLERFRDRAGFCVDLGGAVAAEPGLDERVLSALEIYDVLDRTVVQSFEPAVLARLRGMNPEVRLVLAARGCDLSAAPPSVPAEAIAVRLEELTEATVLTVRAAGCVCYTWTVSEPAEVDRLVGWGVGGFITTRPGVVRARLGGQAAPPGHPPSPPC